MAFIAMEYVAGRTLAEVVAAERAGARRWTTRADDRPADRRRAGLCAPARAAPSRHQAVERDADRRGPRQAPRFRSRTSLGRDCRRRRANSIVRAVRRWRDDRGHVAVHVAGAGDGPAARRPQRHVLARSRPLRAHRGPARVRRRQRGADLRGHPSARAASSARERRRPAPARSRSGGAAHAREERRRSIS